MNVDPVRRRPGRVARWFLLPLLYLAIAAAFIGANPLRGETTGPFDLLVSYPGWSQDGIQVPVRHGARSDILDAVLPRWIEARRQIREGVVPLWNALRAGGSPALFDPTDAQMTAGFVIFALAPDPALGFYLCVLVTMAIAGLGMHLLVSRYCGQWPALFAGISYMACGFITAWLYWPHTHTAIWIPWILLAVTAYASSGSIRALTGISIAVALMFVGGFPFVVALGMGAALLHGAMVAGASTRGWGQVAARYAGVVAAIGIGIALAGIPLMTMVSELGNLDLSYRSGGSGLMLEPHRKLLLLPWAGRAPQVESNMYVGMTAMLLALFGLINAFGRNRNMLAVSGACFFAIGAMLTFGLLPREIGAHLPVLSNNPWNRAILLMDIGLILLAAVGFERLLSRVRWRAVALLFAAVLCVVQGLDLGRQFRMFNGATPSRFFYPVNPALAALKREIRPFQSVAQDSGYFMISGTLGGIGLAEWYAHSLRPPPTGRLLAEMAQNPFTSPTATAIRIQDYRWRSPLLDETALCYAVSPKGVLGRTELASQRHPGRKTPLAPINGVDVDQEFGLQNAAEVRAISISMATYRARGLDGEVALLILDASGREVARTSHSAAGIVDNAMAILEFPRGVMLPVGRYRFRLRYTPGPRNLRLTAWVAADAPGNVRRNGESVPGSLIYDVLGPPDGSLRMIAESGNVVIARNSGCVDGAYRTTDLSNPLAGMVPRAAVLRDYIPHRFSIDTVGGAKSFIIVPMQMREGWRASINGNPAPIEMVHGVMPAVAVPGGRSSVEFRYQPPRWKWGAALMAAGLLGLLAAWLLRHRSLKIAASRG